MDVGMPGRTADSPRAFQGMDSAQEASVDRIERKGAALVASHWLRCFDSLGGGWAHESFHRRMAGFVGRTMEAADSRPGDYLIREHAEWLSFPVDWRNTVAKRFKGRFNLYENDEGNAARWEILPFKGREVLRKPRGCTHFRFFAVLGVMCDFRYSEGARCYVPVQPHLLGLNAITYSDQLPAACEVPEAILMEVELPGLPVLGNSAVAVLGFGLEFWAFGGKEVPEGRFIERVMQVI
jgi:hypothetical protein